MYLTLFSGNLSYREDIEVNVELVHNLYSGLKGDFKMLVSNKSTSDEYYGLVGVALFKADKEQNFVAIVGDVQVEIKPGTVNRRIGCIRRFGCYRERRDYQYSCRRLLYLSLHGLGRSYVYYRWVNSG